MNFQAEKRRRESSYTEALDDPFKYMELVKKTLGQHVDVEEEVKKFSGGLKTQLENIDEEVHPPKRADPKQVDFIKSQFSQFTLSEPKTKAVKKHSLKQEQDLVPPMQPTFTAESIDSHLKNDEDRRSVDLTLSVSQIAKQFGLNATYDTLEGHQKLSKPQLLDLLEFSSVLAKD